MILGLGILTYCPIHCTHHHAQHTRPLGHKRPSIVNPPEGMGRGKFLGWRRGSVCPREKVHCLFPRFLAASSTSTEPRTCPKCPMLYGLPLAKLPQFERVGRLSFYGNTRSLSATLIRPQTWPWGLRSTGARKHNFPPLRPGAISRAGSSEEPGGTQ